jgi:hypothetical protein
MSAIRRCECGKPLSDCEQRMLPLVLERDTALTDRVRLVGEVERLRLQVSALENDGMELAAKLGEAEEQIARLTASGRQ